MSDESDSTIELNRRRVLSGLGVIGLASAGAGAGTMALFSDTETSSGNAVQAGTLDLNDGVSSASFSIGGGSSGLEPGERVIVEDLEYFREGDSVRVGAIVEAQEP